MYTSFNATCDSFTNPGGLNLQLTLSPDKKTVSIIYLITSFKSCNLSGNYFCKVSSFKAALLLCAYNPNKDKRYNLELRRSKSLWIQIYKLKHWQIFVSSILLTSFGITFSRWCAKAPLLSFRCTKSLYFYGTPDHRTRTRSTHTILTRCRTYFEMKYQRRRNSKWFFLVHRTLYHTISPNLEPCILWNNRVVCS